MFKKSIQAFFLSTLGILIFYACTSIKEPTPEELDLSINLKWVAGVEIQSRNDVRTGITWALAQLGATLPLGSLDQAIIWAEGGRLQLDLSKVGFNSNAKSAFSAIIKRLKLSEEYRVLNAIDIGRFIMLSLNSSYHYYKIVGMPETLAEFKEMYQFNGQQAELVNSSISFVDRLIEVADASSVEEIAYVGGENGDSFMDNVIFEPTEFEVLDIMPNGLIRFGIYGANGRLKAFAPESLTIAGKPAKCIWCHETNVQPFFLEDPVRENTQFLTAEQFNAQREVQMSWLVEYRLALLIDLDYSKLPDHERTEELYEEFMEPTLERLMGEWEMSESEVRQLLQNISGHNHPLYGTVYHRSDVDEVGPYNVVGVPDRAREPSGFEPNFF